MKYASELVRLMSKAQRVEWAIWFAEEVIGIFEKEHPDDSRPRDAINVAKAWLSDPTKENTANAYDAYTAAVDAVVGDTDITKIIRQIASNAAASVIADAGSGTFATSSVMVANMVIKDHEKVLRKGADILNNKKELK